MFNTLTASSDLTMIIPGENQGIAPGGLGIEPPDLAETGNI